jgi:hypothetical protein
MSDISQILIDIADLCQTLSYHGNVTRPICANWKISINA